ncbi:MAG: hypothetical protein K2J77_06295 [Oscillospiraceae bacterium]|nr:hypothetical protein [Oscillospiraceae bacterium]
MEFVIYWSVFGIVICVLFYAVSELSRRLKAKEAARIARRNAEEYEELCRKAAYNREHLPNDPLPPIHPIPEEVDRIILALGYDLYDSIENQLDLDEYDSDSVSYVRLIYKDIMWFVNNPTDVHDGEEYKILEEYLRGRYPISDESIKKALRLLSRWRCMPNL